MNICVFGNQDNAGYRLCQWLRGKGHNAQLYLMRHWESVRSMPESIDPYLAKAGYPDWICFFENTPLRTIIGDKSFFRSVERNYDVVIVIGSLGMMNAYHFSGIPVVNISTGPSNQGVIKMWDHISVKHRLFWTVLRYFVRKSVKKCAKIFVHYDPEIYSLAKLGALSKAVFFGYPEDVAGNAKRVDQSLLNKLRSQYSRFDRVFLWLGRIAFSDQSSPMYKGTDKFIKAASRITSEHHNIRLVIGKHGEDYPKLLEMVEATHLEPYIDWVDHMPYWKLLTYLSIPNAVVFDELTDMNCVSSGIFRESLSVGTPLVRSYSPILTEVAYGPDCPVLHACTTEEVYIRMREIIDWSDDRFREEKERAIQWAKLYLHWESQIDRLLTSLEEIIYAFDTVERLRSRYEQ